jgi:hypothetical protein
VIVRIFKNLSDTRWFTAIVILFLLFVPFNYTFTPHHISHTFLSIFSISSWFNYQPSPIINLSIIALVITTAIFFHHVLVIHKLTPARNFTGLLFTVILLVVWHPTLISFEDLFTLILLFLGLFRLLSFEESTNPLLQIFDSAFLICLSCIINIFLLPLILLPLITLVHFRNFHLRLWLAAFTGIILPVIFLNSFAYFLSGEITFFALVSDSLRLISIDITHLKTSPYHWIGTGLFIVPAIFRSLSQTREKKIAIRKKTILLIWFFLLTIVISLFDQAPVDIIIYLIAFSSGFFISSSLKFLYERKLFALLIDLGCIALIVYHSFF